MRSIRSILQGFALGTGYLIFALAILLILNTIPVTSNPLFNVLVRIAVGASTAVWLGSLWVRVLIEFQDFTSNVVSKTRQQQVADIEFELFIDNS